MAWHGETNACGSEPGNGGGIDRSANNIGDTIRIRRPPRVFTDERGRTVWMSEVEPVELEIELNAAPGTDPYDSAAAVSG